MSNRFGTIFSLTSFGESHGVALGGVIDGCPPGITLDMDDIQRQMARRRPGQSALTTARQEDDSVVFLSGIHNGVTTGTPIGFYIANNNQRSDDYKEISMAFRPGHADYTYFKKYNGYNDIRGGGRSSARETASRVVAGAVASQILKTICPDLSITAYTHSIGDINVDGDYSTFDFTNIESNPVRCPVPEIASKMEELILEVKSEGDTVGGIVACVVKGCPVGIGEPVFDKLNARLASAMMSINAAKGIEIGMGFEGSSFRGSQKIDKWVSAPEDRRGIRTISNNSGGVQGGISNGEDIVFRVAFKPVATLLQEIDTVDAEGKNVILHARGRHDPCVVPRAVPIVEAMTSMVLLDQILLARAHSI